MSRDGKKTGGKDFKPGQSGNPNGRPKLSLEAREFRTAAKDEIIEEFKHLWNLSVPELDEIVRDREENEEPSDIPVIRVAIARALLKAAKYGSMFDLNQILDRVIGKVKDEVDLNHKGQLSFHAQVVQMIEQLDSQGGKNGDNKAVDEEKDQNKKD